MRAARTLLAVGGLAACAYASGEEARPSLAPPPDARDASVPRVVDPAPRLDPAIIAMRDAVNGDRLLASITSLVAFGTRNSCSVSTSKTDGVGAARDFLHDQLAAVAGLEVRLHTFRQEGCASGPTMQANVVGVLPGSSPTRLVVVGGHYDSRSVDVFDGDAAAPGANDSGSQSAVVAEVARVLAGHRFAATLVFVAFAGEEQGLLGSAAFVRDLPVLFPGGRVEAMLDLDIIGGDREANDPASLRQFRLYSPGTPRETSPIGGDGRTDDTSPARGLMRFIGSVVTGYVSGMTMSPQLREDRPGRGGDHQSFLAAAIPGVRFIEAKETALHQHTADDTLANLTPDYVTRMAQVVSTTAASLARAPRAPTALSATRTGGSLAIAWQAPLPEAVDHYVVAVRSVGENAYRTRVGAADTALTTALSTADAQDPIYVSVAAVDADGHESLFAYPELRCDPTGCAPPADADDVTTTTN